MCITHNVRVDSTEPHRKLFLRCAHFVLTPGGARPMRPHHQLPLDNAACDQAWSICQGGAAIGSRRQSDPKPRNAQEPIFSQINGTPRSCPPEKV